MAHSTEWHAEYLRLEIAADAARDEYRAAKRDLGYKRVPAGAQARHDAALDALRAASKARWDFEMAACTIVRAA